MARILVINPNASAITTQAILHSAMLVTRDTGTSIEVVANHAGPPGIESDADVAAVIPQLRAMIAFEPADCHVIACFSDPGLGVLRGDGSGRIIGIGEAAYRAAAAAGDRFGIISIVQASIQRHRARLQALGLDGRLAGDRAIDMGVAELEGAAVAPRLLAVGKALRQDGASCIVLGCAGLGRHRDRLQAALGLPVIDPVQVAVAEAVTVLEAPAARRAGHN